MKNVTSKKMFAMKKMSRHYSSMKQQPISLKHSFTDEDPFIASVYSSFQTEVSIVNINFQGYG